MYHVSDLIRITIDSQRLVHLFPSPSVPSVSRSRRPSPPRARPVQFKRLDFAFASSRRHRSRFSRSRASLAHRVSRRHARDRQRLDLASPRSSSSPSRSPARRPRPARRSRRRVVSSIRSASRVVASTLARLVARRASRRRASDVRRRRPSRVVAVCRAPSSRRFAPRVVEATRRSVWFVWSHPTVRVVRVVSSDGPCAPGFDPRASAIF